MLSLLEHWAELIRAAGEAIVIAGVLALIVDRPLKRALLREAAQGIFKHMLGFDHQPEIKERLQEIALETRLFVRRKYVHLTIEALDNHLVRTTANAEVDLVNPSSTPQPFEQLMQFECAEEATSLGMGLICS